MVGFLLGFNHLHGTNVEARELEARITENVSTLLEAE
jgi:hypothetical protein